MDLTDTDRYDEPPENTPDCETCETNLSVVYCGDSEWYCAECGNGWFQA